MLVLAQLTKRLQDSYNELQRGVARGPHVQRVMAELDAEVLAQGGWSEVTTVHVVGKNYPDPRAVAAEAAAAAAPAM